MSEPTGTPGPDPAEERADVGTRVVGAALLDAACRPTHVLAAQRAYPTELRGLWEFPGGKQEPGEAALDALVRECREELDLQIQPLQEVPGPTPDGWPLAGTAVMRVFTAVVASRGTPDSEEPGVAVSAGEDHLDVRWLPLADPAHVLGLPWIPADLPIVAALLEMLRTE